MQTVERAPSPRSRQAYATATVVEVVVPLTAAETVFPLAT